MIRCGGEHTRSWTFTLLSFASQTLVIFLLSRKGQEMLGADKLLSIVPCWKTFLLS